MSLINPAILWGFALVSIPVILHFLLRARPKKYLFPALRLIQARRTHNIRRLRLRHIWLLLLRMGVLALLVMAIARPTLPAANYHPSGGEWLRTLAIAAVVIGTYVWFTRSWKQQRLPQHLMSYRRALLRAAAGAAALLAFLLIVAVPYGRRISAEMSSPLPTSAENLPVSAVFLFDSSLSMSYRYQNLTRLEAAQAIAVEHLGRLPTGSRVAVADTSSDLNLVFQAEQSGAVERIQKLAPRAVSLPLADRIRAALQLQEEDIKPHGRRAGQRPRRPPQGPLSPRDLLVHRSDGRRLAGRRSAGTESRPRTADQRAALRDRRRDRKADQRADHRPAAVGSVGAEGDRPGDRGLGRRGRLREPERLDDRAARGERERHAGETRAAARSIRHPASRRRPASSSVACCGRSPTASCGWRRAIHSWRTTCAISPSP